MEEWKTYTASDFCIKVTDGTHDSPKPKDSGHYLITSKHLKDNCIDFSLAYRISEEDYQKIIKRSNVVQHDILFSMIGTIGNIVRITAPIVDFAVKNMAIFKMGGNELKSKWLYYWLQSPSAKEYIASRLAGSTQAYLTLDSIRQYPISSPSEVEMKRIVDILQSIDDKIEINNRINHNLEQQAQALFSHWLNNCEDKVAISELCDNILDYTPITAKRVVALNSSDVTEGVFAELSYTPISEIKGQFKKRFEKGDILYSEIRPRNLHYAYCYFNPMDYIASTRLMVIRSKSEKLYSSVMLYQYLQMPKVFEEFTSKTESRSGTFPQGNFKDLSSSIVPYSGDNEEISIILESLYKLIWKNIDENKSLSSLRDSLLPILMSGELKINDLTC